MNSKSLIWGMVGTVVWLLIIFLFSILKGYELPSSLNELGDALAGIVAPIAFFWLILGYVQQGKQLEQNTRALEQQEKALQLQIDEMKESVNQQKDLVHLQRKQADVINASLEPHMEIVAYFCEETVDEQLEYDEFGNVIDFIDCKDLFIVYLDIVNKGNKARKITIKDHNEDLHFKGETWDENEQIRIAIQLADGDVYKISKYQNVSIELNMSYKNIYSLNYNTYCQLTVQKNPNGDNIQISYNQFKPLD